MSERAESNAPDTGESVMHRRETRMPDGRLLIYFDFDAELKQAETTDVGTEMESDAR